MCLSQLKRLSSFRLWILLTVPAAAVVAITPVAPLLSGRHYRVTVVLDGSFVTASLQNEGNNNNGSGRLLFGGYLIEMLSAIADRANFTYDLLTPSGFGAECNPQLLYNSSNSNSAQQQDEEEAFSARYRSQYNCGSNDVTDLNGTEYGTDMYLGLFYISPERQLKNDFTIPFQPPNRGTLVMMGTATGIPSVEDLVEQQRQGIQPAACILGSTAMFDFVQTSYPELQIAPFFDPISNMYAAMDDGRCPIFITAAPSAANFVQYLHQHGRCLAAGQPIGIIGTMDFGLAHYAIGVGKHLETATVNALSYWMNVLMIQGVLAELYQGGTGNECGNVPNPYFETDDDGSFLSGGAIAGIIIGAVAVVTIPLYLWYRCKLKRQEKRYKKRFVQQIARNIAIGSRPGSIPPEKLSEQILHIGQGKDVINKKDLAKWMSDIKMDFISEPDFEALWNAIDIERTGEVDAVEFIVFLSACGPEFERVYREQEKMPKIERLKLAARRLSNIARFGEVGVRRIEQKLDRCSGRRYKTRQLDSFSSTTASQDMDRSSTSHSR